MNLKYFKTRIWARLLVGAGALSLLVADVNATGYRPVSFGGPTEQRAGLPLATANAPGANSGESGAESSREARLVRNADGSFSYVLPSRDGSPEVLTPEEFAERTYYGRGRSPAVSVERPPLYKVLNITTSAGLAWVILGLFGQLMYTARMALQWIVSERRKKSVVPVGFWWLSLVAAGSLIAYFIWRRDIVGILGNSIGGIVYVRNLCLISNEKKRLAAMQKQESCETTAESKATSL